MTDAGQCGTLTLLQSASTLYDTMDNLNGGLSLLDLSGVPLQVAIPATSGCLGLTGSSILAPHGSFSHVNGVS